VDGHAGHRVAQHGELSGRHVPAGPPPIRYHSRISRPCPGTAAARSGSRRRARRGRREGDRAGLPVQPVHPVGRQRTGERVDAAPDLVRGTAELPCGGPGGQLVRVRLHAEQHVEGFGRADQRRAGGAQHQPRRAGTVAEQLGLHRLAVVRLCGHGFLARPAARPRWSARTPPAADPRRGRPPPWYRPGPRWLRRLGSRGTGEGQLGPRGGGRVPGHPSRLRNST